MTNSQPSENELRQLHCYEQVDVVSGDSSMTAFKRSARLKQARWRESQGLPIGTHPMRPSEKKRKLGSRIDLDEARRTLANFLGDKVRQAVKDRLSHPEPHQMIDEDRLFCDLLSSMPMCFNLFGWLHEDLNAAERMVRTLWPEMPGRVKAIHFEWSPGRRDPDYLNNRSAFDVALEVEVDGGGSGIIGIETKYHEHCRREKMPDEKRLSRYNTIALKSEVFKPDAVNEIPGTEIQQIWLDHLLALSMLQHPSGKWRWAKFVLICPEGNLSFVNASTKYIHKLANPETFEARSIESLLDANALPMEAIAVFRERYLW